MTIEERCKLAIERGYTYNPETGDVYGLSGNKLNKRNSKGFKIIRISLDKKRYEIKVRQFAWYCVHKEVADCVSHINGVKDDDRIDNLRSGTMHQNYFVYRKAKGYVFDKDKKRFRAHISIKGKKIHLGYFLKEEDAAQAYLKAKQKYIIYNYEL